MTNSHCAAIESSVRLAALGIESKDGHFAA